jgi:hypothetical protein
VLPFYDSDIRCVVPSTRLCVLCFWVALLVVLCVKTTSVAMEQFSKHVSTENNTHSNRRAVFSVRSVQRGCKKDKVDSLSQLSFRTTACKDMSSGAEELRPQNY